MKKNIIAILVFLFSCLPPSLHAETIVFKTSRVLEGRVFKKTDKEIKVDVGGMLMTYILNDIVSIDGTKVKFYTLSPERAVLNKGLAYSDIEMYDDAIIEFTNAIQLAPDFADAYFNRGLIYAQRGNLDLAIADFTGAIRAKPDFAEACYNRAIAYFEKKEYDKTWEDVHKVEALGYDVSPNFRKKLQRFSGREK